MTFIHVFMTSKKQAQVIQNTITQKLTITKKRRNKPIHEQDMK